jgi:ribosomal protein S18 acetylase RimI-like enzyme
MEEDVVVRQLGVQDLEEAAELAFVGFSDLALATNTPSFLQDYSTTREVLEFELTSPYVQGIGIVMQGKLVGMGFVKKIDVTALDLIVVHPEYQNKKIGTQLLGILQEITKEDFSVRMLAEIGNKKACALLSKMGMEFKQIIAVLTADNFEMDNSILSNVNTNYVVRLMTDQDISKCSSLHVLVNNIPRMLETAMLMELRNYAQPHVLERNGEIVGYSCGFTYTGHTCCLDKSDFYVLLAHHKFINKTQDGTNFLSKFHMFLPASCYPDVLANCLKMGMRIEKFSVMVVKGAYYQPRDGSIYLPSLIW